MGNLNGNKFLRDFISPLMSLEDLTGNGFELPDLTWRNAGAICLYHCVGDTVMLTPNIDNCRRSIGRCAIKSTHVYIAVKRGSFNAKTWLIGSNHKQI
jgi:hypothetical protein